jgi:hypothetical protein
MIPPFMPFTFPHDLPRQHYDDRVAWRDHNPVRMSVRKRINTVLAHLRRWLEGLRSRPTQAPANQT